MNKNEAALTSTRAQRRQRIRDIRDCIDAALTGDQIADQLRGLLFVALVDAPDAPTEHVAGFVYGMPMLGALVEATDGLLTKMGRNVQVAEQAQGDVRVKGRKLDG
jgi:hypothetical protein